VYHIAIADEPLVRETLERPDLERNLAGVPRAKHRPGDRLRIVAAEPEAPNGKH
jgi:hypothetical protein